MAKIAIMLGEEFEDAEFQVPYNRLKQAGHDIDLMGVHAASTIHGKHKNSVAQIKVSARVADTDSYDALLIPGGYSPDHLRTDQDIALFVKNFMNSHKPVAAIGHGPELLIEANNLEGRTLTSSQSVKTDLINAGAIWVDKEVVLDANLITSRGIDDLDAFCQAVEEILQDVSVFHSNAQHVSSEDAGDFSPHVEMDNEGFLQNPDEWNEQLAKWLAKQEGLDELSEARWQVIYALRDYYKEHQHVPNFKKLCKDAHQTDAYCMERLFDNNGSKAWRIAGLPNPGEEINAYL
ncbi:MAG: TusE/DsrC/DsvC family sulfur relay protein [Gammaproteobacteria bacterium]|nr:TusE/DsrC/DsvC family sulfur relay protein [Gammaproteobacteria bacterium]